MENEHEIVEKAQAGDQAAIDTLIESVRGLVYQQASKFKSKARFEDLVGAGFLGAMEAIQICDCEKGKFSNISYYHIREKIREEVYRASSQLSVKSTSNHTKKAFKEVKSGEAKSDHAVALRSALNGFVELDEQMLGGVENECQNFGSSETVLKIMQILDQREREIVERCLLSGESLTSVQSDFDCSRERIRQIRNSALVKLRDECERRGLTLSDLL